ncbi:MAG: hypothetical protein Q9P01_12275 [Anaerolineae bacterium]|nr:hypothetical protein [Anaerolineae bacterium]
MTTWMVDLLSDLYNGDLSPGYLECGQYNITNNRLDGTIHETLPNNYDYFIDLQIRVPEGTVVTDVEVDAAWNRQIAWDPDTVVQIQA